MRKVKGAFVAISSAAVASLGFASSSSALTKVACVGDSITAGAGSTAGNDYPSVLGKLLGAGWEVKNFGDSGKTMMKMPSDPPEESYWLQTTYPASKSYAPDVVVIMLGTNDSKTANWRSGNNMYDADYRAMVGEYQALPSKPHIYVVLPPPATMTSFTISPPVIQNEIVPIIRKIAADIPSLGLIDVFDAFGSMPAQYLIADGVHPNDMGHALLAMTVAKALKVSPGDGGITPDAALADAGSPESASTVLVDSAADESNVGPGSGGAGGMSGAGGATGPQGGGGAEAQGGSAGASNGAGGSSDATPVAAPVAGDDGGCSCRVATGARGSRSLGGVWALALGFGTLATRLARRRPARP